MDVSEVKSRAIKSVIWSDINLIVVLLSLAMRIGVQ